MLGQGVRRGEVVRCLGESAHKVGKRGDAARDEADEDRGQAASSSAVNAKRVAGEGNTGAQGQKGKTSRPSGSGAKVNGCGGLVKPDIVFFGEGLPDRFFKRIPVRLYLVPVRHTPCYYRRRRGGIRCHSQWTCVYTDDALLIQKGPKKSRPRHHNRNITPSRTLLPLTIARTTRLPTNLDQ